jgi:DNA-binding MarR family transcriptional regulator
MPRGIHPASQLIPFLASYFPSKNHIRLYNPVVPQDEVLDPRVIDPREELVDYSSLDGDEIDQIVRVLASIRRWREYEQSVSSVSRSRMRLNETDMRALRLLVAAKNQGTPMTAGALAEQLAITTAAVTKLLDRLAVAGHIERLPHPSDRRAVIVTITQATHEQVRDAVGRLHAHRFEAAKALSPEDREVVIRFLDDLSTPPVEEQNR